MNWYFFPSLLTAPIASAEVNTGEQAINGREFTLHCAVNGTFDNIQWLRNSLPLSADNTTVFGTDNRTLTLNPVKRSDDGDYQCFASNYVSNKISAPYTVRVNCKYLSLSHIKNYRYRN